MLLHDSQNPFFRSPQGAVTSGTTVTLRLLCENAQSVVLRTWFEEELCFVMKKKPGDTWETTVTMPKNKTGPYWYYFIAYRKDGRTVRYGAAYDRLGGVGGVYDSDDPESFQITVYDPAYKTPAFMHGANIYQIFPDRFHRAPTDAVDTRTDRYVHPSWDEDLLPETDKRGGEYMELDFFGGTLTGIMEKLPYLRDMGIDIIYLNPIFKARSNHRYDTGDYTMIDPLLGTEEEFRRLCQEASQYGMRVMLDGVFSHTGEDSRYFNRYGTYDTLGAYQSKESPYYDWYTFRRFPNDYRCWWDIDSLPECRKDHPAYQKFILGPEEGIVPRWIRAGACGWRLDVADELTMDFLRKLRKSAKQENPEAVVLGEVWEDASNKIAYGEMRCYCSGDTLDSVMNYPLRDAIISFLTGKTTALQLVRLINHQAEVYPAPFRYALMNLLGSHDRARVLNFLADKAGEDLPKAEQHQLFLTEDEYALATSRYRKAVALLCALPGCPTVYYGDEAGLTGCHDPFCRRPFPWGKEDKALQEDIAVLMTQRQHSDVLKYGHCVTEALDDDTVVITRYLDGVDALGRETPIHDKHVITIRR